MITSDYILEAMKVIAGVEVSPSDPVTVLGSDSLEMLSAYESLERLTKIEIPDRVLVEFSLISEVIDYLVDHGSKT